MIAGVIGRGLAASRRSGADAINKVYVTYIETERSGIQKTLKMSGHVTPTHKAIPNQLTTQLVDFYELSGDTDGH